MKRNRKFDFPKWDSPCLCCKETFTGDITSGGLCDECNEDCHHQDEWEAEFTARVNSMTCCEVEEIFGAKVCGGMCR